MCCKYNIFVVSHRDIDLPDGGMLRLLKSDLGTGQNISEYLNYCELRAHYWVWRNIKMEPSDYVGFFHYRRYLDLKKIHPVRFDKKSVRPYRIENKPLPVMDMANVDRYDVIAPVWEYTGLSVWQRYGLSSVQRISDLDCVYQIIKEDYPDYLIAADSYLSGFGEYFGNMYIMRYSLFKEYCTWLFGVLQRFDELTTDAPSNTEGYLGERLFGIYFTWLKSQNYKCGESQRVHYACYDDDMHNFRRQKLINVFLPPGSRRRACVRRLMYSGEGK